jgi:hypothetical protein
MGSDGFFIVEIESFACNIRNFQCILFFIYLWKIPIKIMQMTCVVMFFIYHKLKECLRSSNFINKFMV